MTSKHAYLLAGARTPFGRLDGRLADFSALELGTLALGELGRRHPFASQADGAIFGMVMQAGSGASPARTMMYRSGYGDRIPTNLLNSACPAGMDCVVDASRRIERDEGSLYIVGGVDSSSRTPLLQIDGAEPVRGVHHALTCSISGETMAALSERKNKDLGISRAAQDEWALLSQLRAAAGDFLSSGEVFAVPGRDGVFDRDEGIRPSTTSEKLASLKVLFGEDGTITAGNASQIADGAAVGLVGSLATAERTGTEPLARIVDWGYSAGPGNSLHLQPAQASRALLDRVGLRTADVDLWEINEAFAGVVLATVSAMRLPSDLVNPNGGAIALGHPNSATAFRLVLTLAHELRRRDLRRGIATLCGAGGQGIALLIENTRHND